MFDQGFEDVPRRVPDLAKIEAFIGYRPTVGLDEVIERVAAFWSRHTPAQVA